MEIQISSTDYKGLPGSHFIEELVGHGLRQEKIGSGREVSIAFVDEEEMARLNRTFRGREGPTDVLSFPLLEETDAQETEASAEPAVLGEIVVCPPVAKAQAADLGHSFHHEITFLLIHGLLHLAGYDHERDPDAARMDRRTGEILSSFRCSAAEGA